MLVRWNIIPHSHMSKYFPTLILHGFLKSCSGKKSNPETGRHYKVTIHTACTYKTWDRSPVHVIKLQHTQHVPTRPGTGRQYTWQSYNTHGMYLQDPRQVASIRDKITKHTACTYKTRDRSPVHVTKLQHTQHVPTRPKTGRQYTWQNYNTHSMYLQDPKQVASTRDKIATHTACTYKTRNRSPVHVTKLQHTQHVPTRPKTGRQYTWQNYNTHSMYLQDLRQVASTCDKVTITHTACTYKTRERSLVHVTELQYTQHVPTRPETSRQYT